MTPVEPGRCRHRLARPRTVRKKWRTLCRLKSPLPQPQLFTGRIVDLAQVNPHLVSKLFAKVSKEFDTPRFIFTNTRFQDVRASSCQCSHQPRFQTRTAVCITLHNQSTEPAALPPTTEWPLLWSGEHKANTNDVTQPKPAQAFQTRCGWRIRKIWVPEGLANTTPDQILPGVHRVFWIFWYLLRSLATILLRPAGAKTLVAENLLLRQQLLLLRRSRRRSPNLHPEDRLVLGLGSLCLSPRRLARVALLVRPSTLLRCHRALTQLKLRGLYSSAGCRRKPGPKGPGPGLVDAILELKRRNPHLGCPKIAEQLAKSFAIQLNKDTVRRVLAKHYWRGGTDQEKGPSWLSVLAHAKDSLWSFDLFRVESIRLQTHWVLLVMDVYTRRIIGFGVQAMAVDGPSLCRMFNQAIVGQGLPKRLSFDHDRLFEFHRWQANLRIPEIEAVRSVPYAPQSHPFVERLIGTVRREFLDRLFFWNGRDLSRKLELFRQYYNEHRVHRSLAGMTPAEKGGSPSQPSASLGHYRWQSHCLELFELPLAA
jgi:putative transposase